MAVAHADSIITENRNIFDWTLFEIRSTDLSRCVDSIEAKAPGPGRAWDLTRTSMGDVFRSLQAWLCQLLDMISRFDSIQLNSIRFDSISSEVLRPVGKAVFLELPFCVSFRCLRGGSKPLERM